jgi:signal transduction histidine kinase
VHLFWSLSLLAAGASTLIAIVAWGISRAPGWQDMRAFAAVAATAAAYAACDLLELPGAPAARILALNQGQCALAAVHVLAWSRYTALRLGPCPFPRLHHFSHLALPAIALISLVPGLVLTGAVRLRQMAWLGERYFDAPTTPLGDLLLAGVLAQLVAVTVRFAVAWQRGVRHAAAHAVALAAMILMGLNDLLSAAGVVETPYVVQFAFLGPVVAVALALSARFLADAAALARLRGELETLLAERTRALGEAKEALVRAEKLAALGRLASGVAHEVNNPAAAVAANLTWLSEGVARGAPPRELQECIEESRAACRRISSVARELLDAGRLASTPGLVREVHVARAARAAAATALRRCGARVRVDVEVPDGLLARAGEELLVQVLVNLVVNGIQAIPAERPGRVVIRGRRDAGRAILTVEDDGTGMAPETLARVFEPFFTTKAPGTGTGLGLAVARGLAASFGADLRLESEPGRGTRATLDLAEAPLPEATQVLLPAPGSVTGSARRRLLLVDDDAGVRSSLRRLLGTRWEVTAAGGVDEALALVASQRFDLLLLDVMMPDGGGERLYRHVRAVDPDLARRVVFYTGAVLDHATRDFLLGQPQPVLEKPLDLSAFSQAARRLGGTVGHA